MKAEDHFFVKRGLTYYRAWFSPSGKILFWIGLIGAGISSPGLHISAYLMPSFALALLVTALVFSAFFRPKITAQRILLTSPNAGESLVYKVVVKNTGKHPVRHLSVFEGTLPFGLYAAVGRHERSHSIDWLEPGDQASVTLTIQCQKRGIYSLPHLLVGSHFPSGLLRWPVHAGDRDRLIVYPCFISQPNFNVPFNRVYQPGGIAVSSHVGDSTEFLNTREYRHGDRLRDVHWASFARTGKLIVKEYVEEYFVRTGILLDTELPRGEQADSFERRVSVAAGIADSIARKDYIIDIFSAGEELHHFQVGRALAHLENLMELLSCLEGIRRVDFQKVEANLMLYTQQLSSIIVLLRDWDVPRARLCRKLQETGIRVRIIVIRDKPLTLPADQDLTVVSATGKEGLIC